MITSRHNRVVQETRSLARHREGDQFFIEGTRLLAEALDAGICLETVLVTPRLADDALLSRVVQAAENQFEVSEDILAYVADSQHPQGIAAVARVPRIPWTPPAAPAGRYLVLEEVRDPGNLGTIARTCRAAGVDALLLSGSCVDRWNPKAVRASAGALFRLPVLQFPDPSELVDWLTERAVKRLAASPRASLSCYAADLRPPVALVLGNEAHGLQAAVTTLCEAQVRIPMAPGCESLNLAAAAAVLVYASVQQELAQC